MPHITTAMRLSVRKSVADIVLRSLLGRRGITDDVLSVKDTFSSWDNCMSKDYCKWPIIAAIVVGGLMVLSIVTCIVRCACCGMSCCCSCFSFLKCCDCCGGACDGKKNKPHKHLDEYPNAPPNQGYRAPAPMMGGALASAPAAPQFAQFEVGKNGFAVEKAPPTSLNEDALPPMPSWDTASKKHVLSEEEKNAVELGELDPTTGQKVPLMTPGTSAPPSPMESGNSPYGFQPGQGNNGYMGVAGEQSSHNLAVVGGGYGDPRGASAMGGRGYPSQGGTDYGPPAPQNNYGNSQNEGYGYSQNEYDSNGYGGGYGQNQRNQPGRQDSNSGRNRDYPPQLNRQYTGDSRPSNQSRQYSDQTYHSSGYQNGPSRGQPRSQGQGRIQSPPLNNNSGFDFGMGGAQGQYSRPQPQQQPSYNSNYQRGTPAPSYVSHASRDPAPQEMGDGYNSRPYQAGGRNPTRLMPAGTYGGRGQERREPERWDPVQHQ